MGLLFSPALFMSRITAFGCAVCVLFMPVYAQLPQALQSLVEDHWQNIPLEQSGNMTEVYEDLLYYSQNPLPVNTANEQQLADLHCLSSRQIQDLLAYIEHHGRLLSIYELLYIEGFTNQDLLLLQHLLSVNEIKRTDSLKMKYLASYGRHRLLLRSHRILEDQYAYSQDTVYPQRQFGGKPYEHLWRYRYRYADRLRIGFTAEQDAGEAFGSQGFDFYSAHLLYKGDGFLKALSVGDYAVQWGQGLLMWSAYGGYKSTQNLMVDKIAGGLKAYSSLDENRYLRGCGSSVGGEHWQLTAFYSKKRRDANITTYDSLNNKALTFSSFSGYGNHRTMAEQADRHTLGETSAGIQAMLRFPKLQLAFNALQVLFDADRQTGDQPYRYYDFEGRQLHAYSIDYRFRIGPCYLFGETALQPQSRYATLHGLSVRLNDDMSLVLLYRDYHPGYYSPYASAFGQASTVNNQRGLYLAFRIALSARWLLTAYADRYRSVWLRSEQDAPSQAYDLAFQLTYRPMPQWQMYLRFKHDAKELNMPDNQKAIPVLVPEISSRWRYHTCYDFSDAFSMAFRVEGHRQTSEQKQFWGYLCYADLICQFTEFPLKVRARYALFDTDHYDTRLYAYEHDVLYAFAFPAYYYRGRRYYLLLQSPEWRGVSLWLRYARSVYSDRNVLHLGQPEEIRANHRSEIKCQLRWRF